MSSHGAPDWGNIRDLAAHVFQRGEPLTLSNHVITVIQRSAREVAIGEGRIASALGSVDIATELLRDVMYRIDNGSSRLNRALLRMYDMRDAGDLEGARQQMRDVLAVEVVPHYRNIAQSQLEMLDDWEAGRKP